MPPEPGRSRGSRRGACLLALILALAAGAARAECRGTDLFLRLAEADPAALAALEAEARAMPFGRGKLFRLTKAGVAPSYLFGTIHVADPRVTALSTAVTRALESAATVALELEEVDAGAKPAALGVSGLAAVLAKAEERATRLIAPEDLSRVEAALAPYGLPAAAAWSFKPAFLAMVLSQPLCALAPADHQPVLDALIARLARARLVPVVGLETPLEQLVAVGSAPPDAQRDLLLGALRLRAFEADLYETSVLRYAGGDLGMLLAWMRRPAPIGGVDVRLPTDYAERLVEERNRRMRDRALPLLERGRVFIAVGAAHVPGAQGLARLFEEAGFAVEAVE